jgi:hypothetical protein
MPYYDDEFEYNPFDRMSETSEEIRATFEKQRKRADVNYVKYSLPFFDKWKDNRYYKYVMVECYGSGQQDSCLRNAVTGLQYTESNGLPCTIKVGSSQQDLLFKVVDSTAFRGRKEPLVLYYDSPEQYENHFYGLRKVDEATKKWWNQRSLEAQKRLGLLSN